MLVLCLANDALDNWTLYITYLASKWSILSREHGCIGEPEVSLFAYNIWLTYDDFCKNRIRRPRTMTVVETWLTTVSSTFGSNRFSLCFWITSECAPVLSGVPKRPVLVHYYSLCT